MSSNLDGVDINQTVVYIPYSGTGKSVRVHGAGNKDLYNDLLITEDDKEPQINVPPPYSPFQHRDLPNGQELRLAAYRKAWNKCLDQVQAIIRALHSSVAVSVVNHVHSAYSGVLPGLPYAELPVISVIDPAASSSFLDDVTSQLDHSDEDDDLFSEASPSDAFVAHLYPTDCPNVMMSMKALITGFVERHNKVKRKPTTSLANYDMELLEAWYNTVQEDQTSNLESLPKLVVVLHNFERFDPSVVQDILYICSLHIPRLPLVFILSLSSPPSPSYLHLTYPRSTLALLHVHDFEVPSGNKVLGEILLKTFFDVKFEPDIVLGPATLDFLADYFTRHHTSLDSVITILQLAHLKHFTEPLTLLAHSTPTQLSEASSFPFLDSLLTRLYTPLGAIASPSHATDWRTQSLPDLLTSLDTARAEFYNRARRMRLGFGLVRLVQGFMVKQGHRGIDSDQVRTLYGMMSAAMKGRLGREIKYLGTMVRKLSVVKLGALLEELHVFFHEMPSCIRRQEEESRRKIVVSIAALPKDDASGIAVQLAGSVGDWLTGCLNEMLTNLEETRLWDIWYTGQSSFPSDLINPSVRASILSGLLRPYDYVESSLTGDQHSQHERRSGLSLWELPDTSILFRRYLDSGKMINVYDWFDSFSVVLENQRKNLRAQKRTAEDEARRISPRKGKGGKEKGKQKQVEVGVTHEEQEDEDGEEKWKMEVQARFMRALHELDYLGFLKHTGRKTDHVLRTVFDIPD